MKIHRWPGASLWRCRGDCMCLHRRRKHEGRISTVKTRRDDAAQNPSLLLDDQNTTSYSYPILHHGCSNIPEATTLPCKHLAVSAAVSGYITEAGYLQGPTPKVAAMAW